MGLGAYASLFYYLRRAPTGTSSRKLASTGFPPSSDAATIIPFDSKPAQLPRSQVGHDDDLPADQSFRRIGFGDSRQHLPHFGADIDLEA